MKKQKKIKITHGSEATAEPGADLQDMNANRYFSVVQNVGCGSTNLKLSCIKFFFF